MPDHSFYTAGKSVWLHRGSLCLALSDALLHILVETRCLLSVNMLGIETSSRSAAVSEMLRPAHVAPASTPACHV